MNTYFITLGIRESEFGGESSEAIVKMENKVAVEVRYFGESGNYIWSEGEGWANEVIGLSEEEIEEFADQYFDWFEDEYRRPRVVVYNSYIEEIEGAGYDTISSLREKLARCEKACAKLRAENSEHIRDYGAMVDIAMHLICRSTEYNHEDGWGFYLDDEGNPRIELRYKIHENPDKHQGWALLEAVPSTPEDAVNLD